MRSFEYFAPTKVIFGKNSHLQIGDILKKENCHKVLIHYGGKSAVASGLIDEVSGCLNSITHNVLLKYRKIKTLV